MVEVGAADRLPKVRGQEVADHGQGDAQGPGASCNTRGFDSGAQEADGFFQNGHIGERFVVVDEKAVDQPIQFVGPFSGGVGGSSKVGECGGPFKKAGEATEQDGPAALDAVAGQDGFGARRVLPERVTQHEAVQAMAPGGLLLEGGLRHGFAVVRVSSPADAGLLQPVGDGIHVGRFDAELAGHGIATQEIHQLGGGKAAVGQSEHLAECLGGLAFSTCDAVGQHERNGGGRVGERSGEDGFDIGGVGVQVRRLHLDVPRLEVLPLVETFQELVAEHFHLAHFAVAEVELDGAVGGHGREIGGGSTAIHDGTLEG